MPRPATGSVVAPNVTRKSWAIRFRVHGKRINETLGRPEDGWTQTKAEEALSDRLAEVQLGTWRPRQSEPESISSAEDSEQTFHEFAESWFEASRHEWSERTVADYRWALELHVLPFFADMPLSAISIEDVDRFRTAKLQEGKLAPAQVNKCIKRVSQIMELAEEYDLIRRNPARGRRRKAKEPKVQRTWVEPEQAMSLVEGSSSYIRPVVAVLLGTGLRPGEATALEWSQVNLATATIKVGVAKTDAGTFRELDLPSGVVEELTEWKLRSERLVAEWQREHPGEAPVFLTKYAGKVRRQSEANISRRLKTSIKRANEKLAELGIEAIGERVTPYSLRRTYASLRAVLGDDPLYASEQMGHKDVRFTLNVYSRAVKRPGKLSGAYRAEFDRALAWAKLPSSTGPVWAQMGTKPAEEEFASSERAGETA